MPAPEQLHRPLHYRGHIAGLDVLRGAAVLAVVVHHGYWNTLDASHWKGLEAAWVTITGFGHLGVHLFFVLSGFLIAGILLDGKDAPGAAQRFYLRRARRILPAYLVLLAVLSLTHLVDWHYVLASLLFVVNMSRLVGAHLTQFSSLWSLAVEEQFYLVWPWVLWRCNSKTIRRTMLLCLLLPPLLRLGFSLIGQDSYFKTWVNADYLMYGALVAYTLRSGALHSGNIRRIARLLTIGGVAGIALCLLTWSFGHDRLWTLALFNAAGRTPAMMLFVAMLLSCLIAHQSHAAGHAANDVSLLARLWQGPRRLLIFLGYISYGLYLVHMLVFRLYDRHVAGTTLGGFEHSFALLSVRAVLCSIVSVLVAWLSRVTLEQWFLRRNLFRQPSVRTGPVPTPPAWVPPSVD